MSQSTEQQVTYYDRHVVIRYSRCVITYERHPGRGQTSRFYDRYASARADVALLAMPADVRAGVLEQLVALEREHEAARYRRRTEERMSECESDARTRANRERAEHRAAADARMRAVAEAVALGHGHADAPDFAPGIGGLNIGIEDDRTRAVAAAVRATAAAAEREAEARAWAERVVLRTELRVEQPPAVDAAGLAASEASEARMRAGEAWVKRAAERAVAHVAQPQPIVSAERLERAAARAAERTALTERLGLTAWDDETPAEVLDAPINYAPSSVEQVDQEHVIEALSICATFERVGLLDALRGVVELIDGHGASKGDARWRGLARAALYEKAERHLQLGWGGAVDPDSGRAHSLHAAVRCLMLSSASTEPDEDAPDYDDDEPADDRA